VTPGHEPGRPAPDASDLIAVQPFDDELGLLVAQLEVRTVIIPGARQPPQS
jgi:hypothetical protein